MNRINEQISRYSVISFDLFDTLIKRNVRQPRDVFGLVVMRYCQLHPETAINFSFIKMREDAYLAAYAKFKAKCTLDDIYNELRIEDVLIKNELKLLEKEIEIELCIPNEEILCMYEYIKSMNKRIVLISDMYLDKDTILSVLKKCGIHGYEKLFVSCEYGVSKTDGGLYEKACEILGINTRQLFHIGDGLKNDIIRARMKGIKGYHVRLNDKLDYDSSKNFDESKKVEYSLQQAVLQNNMHVCKNEIEKLGFQTIGPLVYGFCCWLKEELQRLGIEKVFFLAREGAFLKRVFEELFNGSNIESHYLYASRRSWVIPSYWITSDYESVVSSIAKSNHVSISAILERWGLKSSKYVNEVIDCELRMDEIVDGRTLNGNSKIKKLFDLVKKDLIDNSQKEFMLLKEYMSQENFQGKCAIVDIGWNGAMQKALEKMIPYLKDEVILHGFYFGINTKNLGGYLSNIHGYVYEQSRDEINRYYIYSFAGPLELSFTASHGTTIKYIRKEDKVIPVFASGEYICDDGTWTEELEYSSEVQNGAMHYVNQMKQYLHLYNLVNSEVAFKNCLLWGVNPQKKHIEIFRTFTAKDLGETQHFVSKKYNKLWGKYSIINGFWKSTWKCGYMKSIMKLPLPYHKLYVTMRKRKD